MGMSVEVVARTWYTVYLSDDDIEKIKQYIKDHPEEMRYKDDKKKIIEAVNKCSDIELYEDYVESDFATEEIKWSEFEERTAEEILGE